MTETLGRAEGSASEWVVEDTIGTHCQNINSLNAFFILTGIESKCWYTIIKYIQNHSGVQWLQFSDKLALCKRTILQ